MSVQSFTEMTSRVFGDSGASGLGGKEQSAKPRVNIGKIPLDEMMNHLHDRGMNLDELIENLSRGVAEQLGNPGDHAAFPQPGGSDVPQGEGLFGDWMNPGTDMNPNDPFGRGNNRDTMNDLLTTPTRDRLLFPGESGYEGDSGKDWSALGSKQPETSSSSLRKQLLSHMKQSASTGSMLKDGSDFELAIGVTATLIDAYAAVVRSRLPETIRFAARVPQATVLTAVGLATYQVTTRVMEAVGWSPLGGVTMDQSQRGLQRSNEGCGVDPSDPDDPANGNQPAERSKPIDLSQGVVGQGNPEEISGGPRGRVYATPRGLELAPSNRPTLMDMLGQPGRGDAGRTVGTHRGFSIDAVINPVPDEGWSAFGSKDS
jgi:hypothetical protein